MYRILNWDQTISLNLSKASINGIEHIIILSETVSKDPPETVAWWQLCKHHDIILIHLVHQHQSTLIVDMDPSGYPANSSWNSLYGIRTNPVLTGLVWLPNYRCWSLTFAWKAFIIEMLADAGCLDLSFDPWSNKVSIVRFIEYFISVYCQNSIVPCENVQWLLQF